MLAAFGCGSSDAGSSPQDDCETILTDYCGHGADCIVQDGLDPGVSRDSENQSCLTAARQSLPCGKAVSIGPSYSACVMDVNTTACSAFASTTQGTAPPLPADCVGVVKFTQ